MTVAENAKNAELELQHIELELRNERAQHLRHFVDQYYCYKHGFVNRNGHANWEAIVWKGLVSVEARGLGDRKKVVKEHVVPLKVVRGLLIELATTGNLSCTSIASLLDLHVRFATISKREDQLLRRAGLTSKMPEGFRAVGHPLYGDPLARYRALNIVLE